MTLFKNRIPFLVVAPLALALLAPAQAQGGKGPSRKGQALKHAEAILGKPLNPTQKKAIRAANGKRQKSIKLIQENYHAEAAKVLGLTPAQYKERETKIRPNKKKEQ